MFTVVIWHRLVSTCCWYLISREIMVMSRGNWPLLWLAALCHAINSSCELCIWPLIESIVDIPLCLCLILPQHPGLLSVSFLLMFLSILFALYSWQFSSSLLSVVDGQCLFYGLAVPSRRALARARLPDVRAWLEAWVEGVTWSCIKKRVVQCMLLDCGDEWDLLCRSHRLGKRGSWIDGGCRTKSVCSEMSPLSAGVHIYDQYFAMAETSLKTCGSFIWKYRNPYCL